MLQILNPFKAGQEFQKLKSEKKWILALLLVLVPVLLSAVGNYLIQQKNQELIQQMMEERGVPTGERPEGRGPRGPMGGIFGRLFQGTSGMSPAGTITLGVVLSILFALVFWVVKSVVFHTGARVLGGEGSSISSTIHVIAYTYIPFVFRGILDIVKGLAYDAPSSMGGIMFQPRNTDFLLNFVRNYFTIFVLWALFLMVIAVREQFNLSTKKAIAVVLIPYIVAWIIRMTIFPAGGFMGVI